METLCEELSTTMARVPLLCYYAPRAVVLEPCGGRTSESEHKLCSTIQYIYTCVYHCYVCLVIANKGPCPTYGPSGSMRDEEISASGTRTTSVAHAPTQNGQAIKAMFRDTFFVERWILLLTQQGFEAKSTFLQRMYP